MYAHFDRIAEVYGEVRTTDVAPIHYIRDALSARDSIEAVDIGCGSGRYDLLLFEHLPNLHLTCIDLSREMLDELSRQLTAKGNLDFETVTASVEDMKLGRETLDCVMTFNAIHHFDVSTFLAKSSRALRQDGQIFIYTRSPSQNAKTIWGQYFPGFLDKEGRLYLQAEMETWIEQADGLCMLAIETFRYPRKASLDRLLNQARYKHYSTFSLYSDVEFEAAVEGFETNIRHQFEQTDRIEWFDENTMFSHRSISGMTYICGLWLKLLQCSWLEAPNNTSAKSPRNREVSLVG